MRSNIDWSGIASQASKSKTEEEVELLSMAGQMLANDPPVARRGTAFLRIHPCGTNKRSANELHA
jgi:hypothetical protein